MPQTTTAQIAERYDKAVRTVNRLAKSGRLPFVLKLPGPRGAYIFDSEEVERVLGQTSSQDAAAVDRSGGILGGLDLPPTRTHHQNGSTQ